MPYTTNTAGTTITSSWGNANVRDQVVTPFASASARDAAITVPVNGMIAYTTDTGSLWIYNGTVWVQHGGTIGAAASTWTPVIGQGATSNIAKTVNQIGRAHV